VKSDDIKRKAKTVEKTIIDSIRLKKDTKNNVRAKRIIEMLR
jgi:hypothetical protein